MIWKLNSGWSSYVHNPLVLTMIDLQENSKWILRKEKHRKERYGVGGEKRKKLPELYFDLWQLQPWPKYWGSKYELYIKMVGKNCYQSTNKEMLNN